MCLYPAYLAKSSRWPWNSPGDCGYIPIELPPKLGLLSQLMCLNQLDVLTFAIPPPPPPGPQAAAVHITLE